MPRAKRGVIREVETSLPKYRQRPHRSLLPIDREFGNPTHSKLQLETRNRTGVHFCPTPMPKNIVICCDGTGNEFDHDHNSNVIKLYSTLIIDSAQVGYYHPGVGTMGA